MIIEIVENKTTDKGTWALVRWEPALCTQSAYSVPRVLGLGCLEASGDGMGELGMRRGTPLGPSLSCP